VGSTCEGRNEERAAGSIVSEKINKKLGTHNKLILQQLPRIDAGDYGAVAGVAFSKQRVRRNPGHRQVEGVFE
jgi:hypothetical protein